MRFATLPLFNVIFILDLISDDEVLNVSKYMYKDNTLFHLCFLTLFFFLKTIYDFLSFFFIFTFAGLQTCRLITILL